MRGQDQRPTTLSAEQAANSPTSGLSRMDSQPPMGNGQGEQHPGFRTIPLVRGGEFHPEGLSYLAGLGRIRREGNNGESQAVNPQSEPAELVVDGIIPGSPSELLPGEPGPFD